MNHIHEKSQKIFKKGINRQNKEIETKTQLKIPVLLLNGQHKSILGIWYVKWAIEWTDGNVRCSAHSASLGTSASPHSLPHFTTHRMEVEKLLWYM